MPKNLCFLAFLAFGFVACSATPTRREPASVDEDWSAVSRPVISEDSTDLDSHLFASKIRLARRFGVFPGKFNAFFEKARVESGDGVSSEACLELLTDTNDGRNSFLDCLARHGRRGLDLPFYHRLHRARWDRILPVETRPEVQRTLGLLLYIDDVTREVIGTRDQRSTNWYIPEKGFSGWTNVADFPFEDGDVVVVIGDRSISAMIAQSTYPQRKYSHAFIVRKTRSGQKMIEALIESGVVATPFEELSSHQLNTAVVLRWKDEATRKQVAGHASRCAQQIFDRGTQYNIAMDLKDETKMFCSQLVATCYSRASGMAVEAFVPVQGELKSEKVREYFKHLGVSSSRMVTPGDLTQAPDFKLVGEFKRVRDPVTGKLMNARLWDLSMMADSILERLELGYSIHFTWMSRYFLAPLLEGTNLLTHGLTSVVGLDGGLLPNGLDSEAVAYITVQEKVLFEIGLEGLDSYLEDRSGEPGSLLTVPLWERRGVLSHRVRESSRARWFFYP